MEKIFAIVVTFNPDVNLLKSQICSLRKQVHGIVYVDNGSDNFESFSNLLGEYCCGYCQIELIRNELNMGLGFAHNQGIQKAKDYNAYAVLILDHDSVLMPHFVSELCYSLKLLLEHDRIAAVGPIYINEITGEQYPITRYYGPFIKRISPSENPVEASVLISSGSLIPLSVLDQIGGMNENLFVDYIDIEWSYRARYNGYKLFAVPAAVMNHQIGDRRISVLGRMVSVHSPLRRYYLSRNSIYMLKCSYIDWGYKLRELTFNLLRIVIFAIISNDRIKYLQYSFRGIWDGVKGRYGACSIK